ncbi:MAG: ABC transporter substrate-binding protein, partial [bacterium]
MFKKLALILMSVTALAVTGVQAGGHSKDRDKTVIFDVDGGKIAQPYNFNYLVPGTNRNQGIHQAVWEPLFILNYESGKIDSWLGDSFVANANSDVWTLNLKKGIKWHDGQDLDADDVVFTIQMLMNDKTGTLNYAAAMQQWIKEVKKQDKHTVVFTLTEPNPRFQLDYFSVKIWGGVVIMPEHVWQGQDPYTFKFYDKEKGWPLGSGAYKLVSASETEFIYDRDDNWWGASQGMSLPAPERLIWAVTSTEENRSMLAARGELDSVMDVTLGAFEAMQARNQNMQAWFDDLPYSWFDPCARQLSINTQVEPWNDPAMRWALNYVIDREEI